MTSIELSEEDIKTISAVLKFSISACPLGGIRAYPKIEF
jgi:hypothetical protein